MDYLKILLVFSFLICSSLSGSDKEFIPPQPNTIRSTPQSSTTTNITTTSTTLPPTTTPNTTSPAPNSTTTSAPTPKPTTTPTPAPNSTTTSTSTPKPSTPSTSTAKPITTPTPAPKPTPTPKPTPSTGNWILNYTNTNYTCLVFDAALQIELPAGNSTEKINVPVNSTADGTCDNTNNTGDILNLRWDGNVVTINFTKNETDKKFELQHIRIVLNDTKNDTLVHEKPEFRTQLDHSYKCAKLQTLNLTKENGNSTVAHLHISHAQFQAFSNVTGHHFYEAIDCETSSITSDVVPIVVGCVLAVLVVVVLVAYLYGRRRCQATGYHSM